MKVKIRIKTPKGNALGIYSKIKVFLIPLGMHPQVESNEENDTIILSIEGDPRKVQKIIKRVAMWDTLIRGVMENKGFRKMASRSLKEGSIEELDDMLMEHTTLEVIKDEEKEKRNL